MEQNYVYSDSQNDNVSIESDDRIPATPIKGIVSPTVDQQTNAKVVFQHNVNLEHQKGPETPSVEGLVQRIFEKIDRDLEKEVVLEKMYLQSGAIKNRSTKFRIVRKKIGLIVLTRGSSTQ